ncbi:MAG: hypothetical protein ACK5QT_11550 [Oligoflexia bacterium]
MRVSTLSIAWLFLILMSLPSQAARPESKNETAWREKMQSLFGSLQGLLVVTVDPRKFNDPANARAIESNAKSLAQAAHAMTGISSSSPDADPSVRLFSEILENQTAQALQAYKLGSREYARSLFLATASQCIACHSRSDSGVKLDWNVDTGPAASLPLHQKAQLLAAGRAYDPAIEKLQAALADSSFAKDRPFEWNQALRTAMILAIRAEKNPSKAISVIEKAMKVEGVPQFVKYDSRDWLRQLRAWESEVGKTGTSKAGVGKVAGTGLSENALHREALRLITTAQKSQRYPMDRAGDVLYLRASSVLHDQLSQYPQGSKSGEAFFLLGVCYEILRDFDLWSLGDTYFEACIHRSPHTELGESCYRKLEESTLAGYTGSAGTQVPLDVEQKLERLRVKAQVMTPDQSGKKRY